MIARPARVRPPESWEHNALYERVREAVFAVPGTFRSDVVIRGVQTTDLFSLNTLLGAAIEEGVVSTLNGLRRLWDPDDRYFKYSFVRQPQTFPDVRLQSSADPADVVLGIEVISGVPRLADPFVDLARHVAEYRNHHWENEMSHKGSAKVKLADCAGPYPTKADEISDQAVADSGRNFGRIARTGLMDDFVGAAGNRLLSGVPARHWRRFFKMFTESAAGFDVDRALAKLHGEVVDAAGESRDRVAQVLRHVNEIVRVAVSSEDG